MTKPSGKVLTRGDRVLVRRRADGTVELKSNGRDLRGVAEKMVAEEDSALQLQAWVARAQEAQRAVDALTNDAAIRKATTVDGPPVVLELDDAQLAMAIDACAESMELARSRGQVAHREALDELRSLLIRIAAQSNTKALT